MHKVIFVDFDDTLCLHRFPINYSNPNILFGETNDILRASKWFSRSYSNTSLIDALSHFNGSLICVTQSGSIQLMAKTHWLYSNAYNLRFKDIVGLSIDCSKEQFISSYREYYGLSKDDCLLIDDSPETRNSAFRNEVCDVISPDAFIELKTSVQSPSSTK